MSQQPFTGDKKAPLVSPLATWERRFIDRNLHRVPPWLESNHLTLMTIAWSAGLILFGWLAQRSLHWLWLSSLMLFLQWLTDSFDGSLGRMRDTGLAKWGFYMDHMLDFIFMSAIFVGYTFLVDPQAQWWLFVLMFIYGAMMASSFLDFGATGVFKITYLCTGPTEIRLLFIVLNTQIILSGPAFLAAVAPWACLILGGGLCFMIWTSHRTIWEIDMQAKRERQQAARETTTKTGSQADA